MHHYYEQVSALTVISLKAEQCMIILVHSGCLLAAPYSAIVLSSRVFPAPSIQPQENVFFIFSLPYGSCCLKGTGKRDILCPEVQLLEPLKPWSFACQQQLPLISSWDNVHFKSALTLEWHTYTYIYIIHTYMCVFLCITKPHIHTSTFLAAFFTSLRKAAVITGSSNGHLSTHISFSRYKQRWPSTPPLMNQAAAGWQVFPVANTSMHWKHSLHLSDWKEAVTVMEMMKDLGKPPSAPIADLLCEMDKLLILSCASISSSTKQASSTSPPLRGLEALLLHTGAQ